jgi:hypothetical protein
MINRLLLFWLKEKATWSGEKVRHEGSQRIPITTDAECVIIREFVSDLSFRRLIAELADMLSHSQKDAGFVEEKKKI